ncbi:tRNA (5-methylaminomethyl-2-thiouridylate)-methyltransferase [Cryptococcus neoformans]|nr:tRNA (5-methylaminomethyl-2-thiouridylate)-methyltransferase [Cryptococcus neoformans var. grubii]
MWLGSLRPLPTTSKFRYSNVFGSKSRQCVPRAANVTLEPLSQMRSSHGLAENELRSFLPTMSDLGLKEGDHVTVGMSGGVDSATTLRILREFPIHLDVIFMRNWDPLLSESPPESSLSPSSISLAYSSASPSKREPNLSPCQWERDWNDVLKVATQVGIPEDSIKLVDLSKEYWSRVFEPAVGVWERGGTPNPDVDCNREIKFGALLDVLPKKDRHFLATGHYGRVAHAPLVSHPGLSKLLRAVDQTKDQTYYLSQMTEQQLSRAILPLGSLLKSDVRRLAEHWGLPNAKKEESMGVCFIGERGKFGDFISQYTSPPEPGYLVNLSGERLAEHKGLWYYTIGQRARVANQLKPMFVAKKGVGEKGTDILVVPGSDHPMLLCKSVHTSDFHWIHRTFPQELLAKEPEKVGIQVRHRMNPVGGRIVIGGDAKDVIVEFNEPIVGVSPGQVVAIWHDGWCLGSGVINGTKCVGENMSGGTR